MAVESNLTFLDRTIATVSPGWAAKRVHDRYWLNHFSRLSEEPPSNLRQGSSGGRSKHGSAETYKKQRERNDEINDARDMEERFCLVRGILDRLEQYVCGQITYQARTGDPDQDSIQQDYFHEWCETCDITGRHRFGTMVGLGFRSTVRDGQFGFLKLLMGDELKIQGIEADRIGGDKVEMTETNLGGIKIDEYGRVTGYDIYKRSRMGQYTYDLEAKPENFVHLFKATRIDQYHGRSWLSAGLPHAKDIHELFLCEKQAMKFAAAFAGFIRRKDPYGPTGGTAWSRKKGGPEGVNTYAAQPGMIKVMHEGEEITFPTSTGRPSGNLMQFVEILIREIALGLNLPYGFVYNMAQLGGVTARIELMQCVRTIRRWQKLLEDVVLNNIKDEVINLGIGLGKIPFHPNWRTGKWSFGARMTGDSGNFIQEAVIMLEHGLTSRSDLIEEMTDSDAKEVARKIVGDIQNDLDIAVSGEQPVPLEMLAPAYYSNATAYLAAANTPPVVPPEPKGLVEKQGEKAAAPLLELLDKYADGRVERETAITTAMHLYGMVRAKAEKLFSKQKPEPDKPEPAGGDKPKKDK